MLCSVLRHLWLNGLGGSSNSARLAKSSVLVEEAVLGVVAVFEGVFGGG
jgi:hypothetical protein